MLTDPLAEAIAEAEKLVEGAPHMRSEQDLAEGYEYLAGGILAIAARGLGLPARLPVLHPGHRAVHEDGPGQPRHPVLRRLRRDDAEYVVTGRRGTTADLSFQVLSGDYPRSNVPGSADRRSTTGTSRSSRRTGTFELRFGPGRRRRAQLLHARRRARAMLLVREVYSDWVPSGAAPIRIHRADRSGRPAARCRRRGDGEALRAWPARSWSAGSRRSCSSRSGST